MKVYFLEGDTPLTKTYAVAHDGTVTKQPYPNAWAFTSYAHDIGSIESLHKAIVQHAGKNHCLLKGQLHRELKAESRAGSTRSEDETNFLCFDLDKVSTFATPDDFMKAIGMSDVSHVVQYSSSSGIEHDGAPLDTRLSCHIFVWLEKPVSATLLKQWLIQLNFTVPELERELSLTNSTNALHYGLDITTCQNDKLLYIAPPVCKAGVIDTLHSKRIALIKRKRSTFAFDVAGVNNLSQNRTLIDTKVNALRTAAGLEPRKKATFKADAKLGIEYLAKPDPVSVTGVKEDRGFVYLNLNGGDSWGYFFPAGQPEVLQNFKGEPNYLLREICPGFYASYMQSLRETNRELTTPDGTAQRAVQRDRFYLAFRDFNTGQYWNGWYVKDTDELVLKPAKSENQLRHFLKQYGLEMGEFVEDWTLEFDPHFPGTIDTERRVINRYKPSHFEYLEQRAAKPTPAVDRLLCHVLGIQDDGDPTEHELYQHFFNWLAYIVQYKRPAGTCWVFHGTQSTGKGLLFNRVLRPIIGEANSSVKRTEEFSSNYNGWMENNLLVMVDEVHMSQLLQAKLVNSKLKNWITEPTVSVEEKYQASRLVPNYNNFIFASNMRDPVHIDSNDRRFNVADYQHVRLVMSDAWLKQIDAELEDFYMRLMAHEVDGTQARTVLQTEARNQMMEISKTAIEVISENVNNGNLAFFFDQMPDDEALLSPLMAIRFEQYKGVMAEWLANAIEGKSNVTRDQLRVVCEYCIGDIPQSAHKFSSYLKHHNLLVKQLSYRSRMVQGVQVRWQPMDKQAVALMSAWVTPAVAPR